MTIRSVVEKWEKEGYEKQTWIIEALIKVLEDEVSKEIDNYPYKKRICNHIFCIEIRNKLKEQLIGKEAK